MGNRQGGPKWCASVQLDCLTRHSAARRHAIEQPSTIEQPQCCRSNPTGFSIEPFDPGLVRPATLVSQNGEPLAGHKGVLAHGPGAFRGGIR